MLQTGKLNYKNFKVAAAISAAIGSALLLCSFEMGRDQFFLLLNTDLGAVADFFFNYLTYIGDGILWIVWLAVLLAKRRRDLLPLIITAFSCTTIFVQVCKQVILPDQPRPSEAIHDLSAIHFIKGITVHAINSFPSGHTATAFTFALLIALLTRSFTLTITCILIACIVGYTRIYQGQHFPLDVGAGIFVAIIAVALAAILQQRFFSKRTQRQAQ